MKDLNSNQLEKSIKKNQRLLIISIVFLILTGVFLFLGIQNQNKNLPSPVSLSSLIEDFKNDENTYAYINVNTKPFLFAVYEVDGKEDDAKYYLVMDKDNYLYIVYMSTEDFNKLNVDSIKEKPIQVTGLTKKIPSDIKSLAIEAYNEEMESEYLTDDNFKDYVGLIYLDMKTPVHDSSLYYVGTFICFLIFLILIIVYFSIWSKNRKVFKKIPKEELEKINSEIYQLQKNNPYEKMKLYFLKDYIVDTSNSIIILKYNEIVWAYPYEYRYNGMLVNKNIKVYDIHNKVYDIANTKYLAKNKDKILQEILVKLSEKNSEIILGFNKENKKIYKEKIKK